MLVLVLGAVTALLVVSGVAPGVAGAAPWCGTTATENRPAAVTGRSVRVVYAIAADGDDRSAEWAPRISSEVDEIAAWWRAQDSVREPRFDLAAFACGLQVDLTVQRLRSSSAALAGLNNRVNLIAADVFTQGRFSEFEKYVVYYDGPLADLDVCGQGGGEVDGPAIAVVYVRACSGVPTQAIAAHELIHALGALPLGGGPPHACPDTPGHPCDSDKDILYPYASANPLGTLVLDVNRDDYYGHSGSWLDIQDSGWLRHVDQQARLSVGIQGKGSVQSAIPGMDCSASCAADWDTGSIVDLDATPEPGQRLIKWTGACAGNDLCRVTLDAAKSVGAIFAKVAYRLTVSVKGKGSVSIAGSGFVACQARCSSSQTSYKTLTLRAKPLKGWRFVRWAGGCKGTAPVCRVPMTADTAAAASFRRK